MKRSDFIEKMSVELATKVGEAQTELLKAILTYVDGAFDIKNGKIISGKTNYGKAYLIDKAYDFFIKNNQQPLVKWFAEKVFDLFGLNRDYYKKFADDEKKYLSISDNVLSEQLARLGVTDKKEFLKGGFLDDLATNKNPLQGIKQKAIAAIAQGKSLSDFKAEMSEFVKGSEGKLGVLERHFNTAAYDEFARFDRATSKAYADNLKLDYAVFEGTIQATTRAFCAPKVGKVFDRKQIASWASLSFVGKPATGYNPFIDLGGYHCRHTLNWIDEATARYIDPARFEPKPKPKYDFQDEYKLNFNISDEAGLMKKYNLTEKDVLALSGGIPMKGLSIKEVRIRSYGSDSSLYVYINSNDIEQRRNLDFEKKTIKNELFSIKNKDIKGINQGIGANMLLNQIEAAKKHEFKNIKTEAYKDKDGKWNGYYTWARYGYDFENKEIFSSFAKENGRKEKSIIELMSTEEGRTFWRKKGVTFDAIFDVNNNNQINILTNYINEKNN